MTPLTEAQSIAFWLVACLCGINAGLGIVVLYGYGEKWWKGKSK